jgi:hypothetical protein
MCCISDEMDVMGDEKEDGNISNEYESVNSECETEIWTVKTLKLRKITGMVNRLTLVKLNEG